jgi:spermidine/putrescine transport system ATP-binding protein
MGEMNHIPGHATDGGVETPFGTLPLPAPRKGRAMVCIRPEAMGTSDAAVRIGPARVRDAAFFGTHTRAHLIPEAAPDLVLIAHLPPAILPEPGAILHLSAEADTISVFPMED